MQSTYPFHHIGKHKNHSKDIIWLYRLSTNSTALPTILNPINSNVIYSLCSVDINKRQYQGNQSSYLNIFSLFWASACKKKHFGVIGLTIYDCKRNVVHSQQILRIWLTRKWLQTKWSSAKDHDMEFYSN